mgnify:CR=1 FL=1|tara:strand:- start:202 stop:708 length:507 start_codon:yes stop_codon:yes gene_type:complete
MSKAFTLYLALGVTDGVGFWIVNFTDEDDIFNSLESKLLECYRKELFGLDGAIEVKEAINTTLEILTINSKFDRYKLDNFNIGYSSEIPINIIEDIFDLWAYNYFDKILWKKYVGLLNLRKKIKIYNKFIHKGLKGDTYKFATKLEKLLNFCPSSFPTNQTKSNDLMW